MSEYCCISSTYNYDVRNHEYKNRSIIIIIIIIIYIFFFSENA